MTSNSASSHLAPPAVRTYRQIAGILAEREGRPITAACVADICHTAEMKIVHAILTDPIIRNNMQFPRSQRPN